MSEKKPSKHVEVEYSKITDLLYLGTNLCCTSHGKKLMSKGFQADISLELEKTETPEELQFHGWIPVRDHYPPSMKQLMTGTAALAELLKNKVKTYAHCKNGHGRSPSLVIAYFMRDKNMTYKEAFEFVRSKRPEIHLWKRQETRLKEFEKKITVNN